MDCSQLCYSCSMSLYRRLVRPILFRCDPEWVHDRTIGLGERLGGFPTARRMLSRALAFDDPRLATSVAGLDFTNPVGMAAGFDKSGRAIRALAAVGFGFVEIGSVSAQPSVGNPRPRLFRIPIDQGIVVHYGVPNDGARVVAKRVAEHPLSVPLGVNVVETNTGCQALPEKIVEQFVEVARTFVGRCDYLALNLNCPNTTAGHSTFDDVCWLGRMLRGYADIDGLPPVFLKFVATHEQGRIEQTLETVDPYEFVKGFIFNLPPGKPYKLRTPPSKLAKMPGVASGPHTRVMINDAIVAWYRRMDHGRYSIIGVGGITCAEEAYEKILLGASLTQLYTALVYHGPGLVGVINRGLCRLLDRDGFSHISQAVGVCNQ